MTTDDRILVLMPTVKDGERTRLVLQGLPCEVCQDLSELCRKMAEGAGAALLAEETLVADRERCLAEVLRNQPAWSDFPLVVLATNASTERGDRIRETMNVTLVERPVRGRSLLSVIRAALRARRHQYAIRDRLAERQRAEEELRRSEERVRLILESATDFAILTLAPDRTVTSWSPGAEAVFGYAADDIVGRSGDNLFTPEDRAAGAPEQETSTALREGRAEDERWHVRRDGSRFFASGVMTPLGEDGLLGYVKVARDLTDRKRMEDTLRDTDRKKDEFIALLAHELRNPLAPIRNGLQVLKRTDDPAIREQSMEIMERQLTHMVRLIDDLLDVSRITQNRMELRREQILLADVVASAVETAGPLAQAAGQELRVTLPGTPIALHADFTRLAQVLSNLLINSVKYTPRAGRIWLTAERQGDVVSVAVRDTGMGIPQESLASIFDMFSQVDRSLEKTTGGLGIGLALVKGLVEMHGGTVTAKSEEGQGSTFTVTLPVASSDQPASVATSNGVRTVGRRILVADDNHDGAKTLATMLRLLHHEVQTAHDGVEAVEQAAAFRPDVILMDVGMPRLNGLDATRSIRAHEWGQSMRIVALTGWGMENDRERSREAGCNGHLVKPVSLRDLQQALAESGHGEVTCAGATNSPDAG